MERNGGMNSERSVAELSADSLFLQSYEWAILDTQVSGVSQASTTPVSPVNYRNVSDSNKL